MDVPRGRHQNGAMERSLFSRGFVSLFAPLLVAAVGCGGATQAQRDDDDQRLVSEWEAKIAAEDHKETSEALASVDATGPKSDAKPTTSVPAALGARQSSGVLQRRELMPTLAAGLGRFLQGVRTAPAFANGKFKGFRLVSFFETDARMQNVDLMAGDVVTGVNGKPIERPEQALEVWQSLKTAPKLTVDYIRGSEVRQLQFDIADN